MIRKWLGVDISKDDIKEQVEQIVFGENFINHISERIANRLHWREEVATDEANSVINTKINNEKFIDDIVVRIKNKQI